MTPADLQAAHRALGLTAEGAARLFQVSDGRTLRRWYGGERPIPGPIIVLTTALMESAAVRKHFNLSLKEESR